MRPVRTAGRAPVRAAVARRAAPKAARRDTRSRERPSLIAGSNGDRGGARLLTSIRAAEVTWDETI